MKLQVTVFTVVELVFVALYKGQIAVVDVGYKVEEIVGVVVVGLAVAVGK